MSNPFGVAEQVEMAPREGPAIDRESQGLSLSHPLGCDLSAHSRTDVRQSTPEIAVMLSNVPQLVQIPQQRHRVRSLTNQRYRVINESVSSPGFGREQPLGRPDKLVESNVRRIGTPPGDKSVHPRIIRLNSPAGFRCRASSSRFLVFAPSIRCSRLICAARPYRP